MLSAFIRYSVAAQQCLASKAALGWFIARCQER